MSGQEPPAERFDWVTHFNQPDSRDYVSLRQEPYRCLLKPGQVPPDYDLEVILTARHAGLAPTDTIVDIGCLNEEHLEVWKLAKHEGKRIGVDPSVRSFRGVPYWKLIRPHTPRADLIGVGDLDTEDAIRQHYVRHNELGAELEGTELFEGTAAQLPPHLTGKVGATITKFSGYVALWDPAAFDEIERVHHDHAMHIDVGSGSHNKSRMIGFEPEMAEWLSGELGVSVVEPGALQALHTTEDALVTFPARFEFAYIKLIRQIMRLNADKEVTRASMATYRDAFRIVEGDLPTEHRDPTYPDRQVVARHIFSICWEEVVGREIDRANDRGHDLNDKVRRHILLASHQPRQVRKGFSRITPELDLSRQLA